MQVKFRNYRRLAERLNRAGFREYGKLSTYLLETFVQGRGRILASETEALGLSEPLNFKAWRKKMVDGGWIQWREDQDDKGQYFAGKRIIDLINEEINRTKIILTTETGVTRSEYEAFQLEISRESAEMRRELSQIREIISQLGIESTPPDTKDKKERRKKLTLKLMELTQDDDSSTEKEQA